MTIRRLATAIFITLMFSSTGICQSFNYTFSGQIPIGGSTHNEVAAGEMFEINISIDSQAVDLFDAGLPGDAEIGFYEYPSLTGTIEFSGGYSTNLNIQDAFLLVDDNSFAGPESVQVLGDANAFRVQVINFDISDQLVDDSIPQPGTTFFSGPDPVPGAIDFVSLIYEDSGGAVNFCTMVSNNIVLNVTATAQNFVAPTTFNVFRGIEISGDVSDFANSDDAKAIYNPGFTINSSEAPVWLEFFADAPVATNFRVESSAGTPGLEYRVEAWNWNTNSYDEIGSNLESFNTDVVSEFPISMTDHIDPSGAVRSRVGWRQIGFTINFPWAVNVDQIGWTL